MDGDGRRSKIVYGMFDFVRRDASVRPTGPAPRIAIREWVDEEGIANAFVLLASWRIEIQFWLTVKVFWL